MFKREPTRREFIKGASGFAFLLLSGVSWAKATTSGHEVAICTVFSEDGKQFRLWQPLSDYVGGRPFKFEKISGVFNSYEVAVKGGPVIVRGKFPTGPFYLYPWDTLTIGRRG